MPTLVIYGDHDLMPTSTARRLSDAIAGSLLVEVPHSGHMTFVDQPTYFLKAVEDFLSR